MSDAFTAALTALESLYRSYRLMKDEHYRFIEKCLYNYRPNLIQFEKLKDKLQSLISVRGHNYEAHIPNVASDPVADVTDKRVRIEKRINELECYITPVNNLCYDLQHVYSGMHQINKILQMKYFGHEPMNSILRELHISQPTYWRRTQELIRLAKLYFALD